MIVLAWVVVVLLLFIALVVARRATAPARCAPAVPIPLDRLTPQRYRPMEKFFPPGDYEFLAVRPGFRPAVVEGLLAERRRRIRQYFRSLGRDFENLRSVARLLLRSRAGERRRPALALWKERISFWYSLAAVDGWMLAEAPALRPADVRRLANPAESIIGQVGRLPAGARTRAPRV